MSGAIAVTIDLDWACEPAIEEVLTFLEDHGIPATVFTTHRSPAVELRMGGLEVGLHPYFAADSSHGATIPTVVQHVLALPHNVPAFRCHRFAVSNEIMEAMAAAGMRVSSNLCTDLEQVAVHRSRNGLLEVPIFFEDGGYLRQQHGLDFDLRWCTMLAQTGTKVLLLHPMHWAINSPTFDYMVQIKRSRSRAQWQDMTDSDLAASRWHGRGIRNLITDLLQHGLKTGVAFTTIGRLAGLTDSSAGDDRQGSTLAMRA